uniref:Uncharacterized protein n=1 Tax=Phasianus colchicus TaxID=9054 RepID=A0A669PVU8_PHACC
MLLPYAEICSSQRVSPLQPPGLVQTLADVAGLVLWHGRGSLKPHLLKLGRKVELVMAALALNLASTWRWGCTPAHPLLFLFPKDTVSTYLLCMTIIAHLGLKGSALLEKLPLCIKLDV